MMNNNETVFYYPSMENTIDIVMLNKVNTVYPLHTHAQHYTMGIVMEGEITIPCLVLVFIFIIRLFFSL